MREFTYQTGRMLSAQARNTLYFMNIFKTGWLSLKYVTLSNI